MAGTNFPGGVQGVSAFPGTPATGVLRFSGNVVHGESITIGGEVWRVAVVNTDSTKTVSGGELNNTKPRVVLTFAAHGRVKGDLIRVENEIARVMHVVSTDKVLLKRGVSGTTIAAHADATAIYVTASSPGAGNQVGIVATLTPAVFTDRFIADFNALSMHRLKAYAPEDDAVVIASADERGGDLIARADTYALAETLTNGAWDAANMAGGVLPGFYMPVKIVPTAADVTAGYIYRAFPFTPTVLWTTVQTVATKAPVVWDGVATVTGNLVKLDNSGSVDWAATDEILMFVRGA